VNRLSSRDVVRTSSARGHPVHWWKWSVRRVREASGRDVPVLISSGYAPATGATSWPTVVRKRGEVAEAGQRHVGSIKVDREETPTSTPST